MPAQTQQPRQGRRERPIPPRWQGVCVRRGEDSHIHGMRLALGIIYKAWLLCGTLSLCLLPLQPMTLPGLPSCPSLHRALSLGFCLSPLWPLLSRESQLLIFIHPVSGQKNISVTWNIIIDAGKRAYMPRRGAQSYAVPSHMALITLIQESFFFFSVWTRRG